MKKIWILAGEASGDIYGAALAAELQSIARSKGETVEISGMGGSAMRNAGVKIKVDSTELGVMGLIEVAKLIFTFIRIFFKLVREAKQERPDAVILIDYPGFNLRFAKAMHRAGIKVYGYICPHLWAWGKGRLPVMARICAKMLVIFPFEVEVFAPTVLKATFVGHPLADMVKERAIPGIARDPQQILLLPGSRKMEIDNLLGTMLASAELLHRKHPQLKFHLPAPRQKIADMCRSIIANYAEQHPDLPEITISVGDTSRWQQIAVAGIAATGTVTVESALTGLPLVVGYAYNPITYLVVKYFVKFFRNSFVMVNIIANRRIFDEYLQHEFTAENVVPAVEAILPGGSRRELVEAGMQEVAASLRNSAGESAARRAALECWED